MERQRFLGDFQGVFALFFWVFCNSRSISRSFPGWFTGKFTVELPVETGLSWPQEKRKRLYLPQKRATRVGGIPFFDEKCIFLD